MAGGSEASPDKAGRPFRRSPAWREPAARTTPPAPAREGCRPHPERQPNSRGRSAPGAQLPSRPNQRGQGRRGARGRRSGRATRGAQRGGCARRRQGRSGAEAIAKHGARRSSSKGFCPFPLGRCRWFDPPPRERCRVPAPAGLYHRAVPPGFLPPTTTINSPPPGSAVGWPRPGSETRKELGAILGGTKQRRNTLPADGVLWTLAYPVPLIL